MSNKGNRPLDKNRLGERLTFILNCLEEEFAWIEDADPVDVCNRRRRGERAKVLPHVEALLDEWARLTGEAPAVAKYRH